MVYVETTRPSLATVQQHPSSRSSHRSLSGKRHQRNETRKSLFSRVYGHSRSAVQAKVAEVIGEEEPYDYSDVPVDADGLPLTTSYPPLAVAVVPPSSEDGQANDGDLEEKWKEEEELNKGLLHFHQSTQVISSLPFLYTQNQHLYSGRTDDMASINLKEGAGPNSLEELMALRLAVTNLLAAFIYVDPSLRGRRLREMTPIGDEEKAGKDESREFHIDSVKRKPVPDYDDPVDLTDEKEVPLPFSHPLPSPEPREELSEEYDSSPPSRPAKLRGVYTARAMKKLEVQTMSSEESEDDEGGRIARLYMAKHCEDRHPIPALKMRVGGARRSKAIRRKTSILDNKDEMKSYLFKEGGAAGYERGSKQDFIDALDEDHRRCTAPAASKQSKKETRIPAMPTSSPSLADSSSISAASAIVGTSATSGSSCTSRSSFTSSLSTLSSSPTSMNSLVFLSSDEEQLQPAKATLGKRSLTDSYPIRPKRHPARQSCFPAALAASAGSSPRSPLIPDDPSSNGLVIQYSQLAPTHSDVTPRPGALGFDTGVVPAHIDGQE